VLSIDHAVMFSKQGVIFCE